MFINNLIIYFEFYKIKIIMENNKKRLSKKFNRMPLMDKYSKNTWKDAEEVNNSNLNFIFKTDFV
jgi:hypothetical protein